MFSFHFSVVLSESGKEKCYLTFYFDRFTSAMTELVHLYIWELLFLHPFPIRHLIQQALWHRHQL